MDRNDVLAFADNLRSQMYENEEIVALNELVGAYEKARPIKPITAPMFESVSKVEYLNIYCGKCGRHIDGIWKRGDTWRFCNIHIGCDPDEFEYCPFCGRKIDWSVLDEVQ